MSYLGLCGMQENMVYLAFILMTVTKRSEPSENCVFEIYIILKRELQLVSMSVSKYYNHERQVIYTYSRPDSQNEGYTKI